MLDPREVESKKFKVTRLQPGYDQEEVDAFLDRVASDYGYMFSRVAEVQGENSRLRGTDTAVIPAAPSTDSLTRILELAEQEAARVKRQATWEASKRVSGAESDAQRLLDKAREDAGAVHAEVLAEFAQKATDAHNRIEELDDQIANLEAVRDSHVGALRGALDALVDGEGEEDDGSLP